MKERPTSWHLREVLELVQAAARNITDLGGGEDLARWTPTDVPSAGTADDRVPPYAFGPRKRGAGPHARWTERQPRAAWASGADPGALPARSTRPKGLR